MRILFFIKNYTWDLVPPPEEKNIVGSRWILKVKRDEDGGVDCFKARLVFSPVARYTSVRSLLALANAHDLEIHQVDVKTTFLNDSLTVRFTFLKPVEPIC